MTKEELSFVEYFTKPYVEKLNWDILSSYENEHYDISKFDKFDLNLTKVLKILIKSPEEAIEFIHANMDYTRDEYLNKRRNRFKKEIKNNIVNIMNQFKTK